MNIKELECYAIGYINRGYWGEKAVIVNKQILSLDDKNVAAYARLARCYREKGKNKIAREIFNKALRIEPENKVVKKMLSDTPNTDYDDILEKDLEEIKSIAKEMALQNMWDEKCYQINKYIINNDKFWIFSYAILFSYHIRTGNKKLAEIMFEKGMNLNSTEMSKAVLQVFPRCIHLTKKDENLLMIRLVKVSGIATRKQNNSQTYRNHCYGCKRPINEELLKCESCNWYICEKCGACGCDYGGSGVSSIEVSNLLRILS